MPKNPNQQGGGGAKNSNQESFFHYYFQGGASVQGKARDGWRTGMDGGQGWLEERNGWRRGMDGGVRAMIFISDTLLV